MADAYTNIHFKYFVLKCKRQVLSNFWMFHKLIQNIFFHSYGMSVLLIEYNWYEHSLWTFPISISFATSLQHINLSSLSPANCLLKQFLLESFMQNQQVIIAETQLKFDSPLNRHMQVIRLQQQACKLITAQFFLLLSQCDDISCVWSKQSIKQLCGVGTSKRPELCRYFPLAKCTSQTICSHLWISLFVSKYIGIFLW